ncbi:dipeptidase [Streptomyces antibioticus]|uniref:Membrane dipeptidase n=1 Tax=Streptomyces antibioticus TaxID=1890 RepID=A0AAE7CIC0_STRAT|nr:membrane dipeptidase [Streptomyces antibioticus]OOQ54619.1 membrane dipeptidase [Streptomyces antibioticus]QIT42245.1 membrane dipeptidase [Streptomyces antibioticus]
MNVLHRRAVVADLHNDLLCAVVARPVDRWAGFFRERWLPQLRAGGVNLQVLPVFVEDPYRPEGALRRTLRMIEAAHRLAAGNKDAVALCADGAEIDRALAVGRIALVLALESAPGVGEDVELLETLFRLGVRIASLAHFGRTALADGSGEDGTGGRLTRAGVAALAEMERLGMLLDVSHLGAAGVEHVLELASRPVLATHSAARALFDHHRNLTDEQIRGVAGGGGVVCVNFFAPYLHENDYTVDRLVDHIEHIVGVAGVEHVGLGPDFIKEVLADTTPPCCERTLVEGVPADAYLPGLTGPAGLPLVTEALQRRGWRDDDIVAVLGGNVLRLFHAGLGRPAAV